MIPGNYTFAKPIAPSDLGSIPVVGTAAVCDAIYVGGAGIVQVVLPDGSTVVPFTCAAGQILPVRASGVKTWSTATLLVALYYV